MYQPITGTGNGSAPVVTITFPYLRASHVKASVDGVDVPFTWTASSQITFDAPVASGSEWEVYRDSSLAATLVDFTDGSVLTDTDLDTANAQHQYIDQELSARIDEVKDDVSASNILRLESGGDGSIGPDYNGKYLTIDASGNLTPSDGSGADSGLRSDLAASSGLGLIGTLFGGNLEELVKGTAIRPVRGLKPTYMDRKRAVEEAIRLSDPATTPIYGFAKCGSSTSCVAGSATTGGFGFTEVINYDPDGDGTNTNETVPFVRFVSNEVDDVNREGSLRWALQQVRDNGGGYVIFHPRGKLDITLKSHIALPNNLTMAAPGRNVTVRAPMHKGVFRAYSGTDVNYGRNIIIAHVRMKHELGGLTAEYDQRPGEVDVFAAVPSYGSNKIALWECEISGATDGAIDIAGGTTPTGEHFFSILRTTIRNTDKVSAIGVGADSLTEDPLVFVTVGESHFEGSSQRKMMASSRSYVHMVNNVDDAVPKYRDYSEGSDIGSWAVGDTRYGGRMRYEYNIVRVGDPALDPANHQSLVNSDSAPGAAVISGNYWQAGITNPGAGWNTGSVAALPSGYDYSADLITDVTTDPDASAEAIINRAGPGRTNWPEGLYVPLSQAVGESLGLHVNGEDVLWHDDHYWLRVDDGGRLADTAPVDGLYLERGGTLTINAGEITLGDDRAFALAPEVAASADTLTTINLAPDGTENGIKGGLIALRGNGSSSPITVTSGGNIATDHDILLDSGDQWLLLFWHSSTNLWHVWSEPRGKQQAAISDSVGGDEMTKINAILAALRGYGVIAT